MPRIAPSLSPWLATWTCASVLAVLAGGRESSAQVVPGQRAWGALGYVEYIEGNAPIVISSPHGGYLKPSNVRDRTYGVTSQDRRTQELARRLHEALKGRFGLTPHLIISHLHRSKLDPNRSIKEAAQGDVIAEQAWRDYHGFIDRARAIVTAQWGGGQFFDIHGHGHPTNWVEIGYLLSAADLALSDATLRTNGAAIRSSIRALSSRTTTDFPTLLRGTGSLGDVLAKAGFRAVPSPRDPSPGALAYFRGGYSTARHGSSGGGTIDGIQLEHPWSLRRDARTQAPYLKALVDAIELQFTKWRVRDLTRGPRAVILAHDPWASESGRPAKLRVARFGDVGARTLDLVFEGAAKPGLDYKAIPTRVQFSSSEFVKDIPVNALADSQLEGWEDLVVRLSGGREIGTPSSAEILIHDAADRPKLELALAMDRLDGAVTPDASRHGRDAQLRPDAARGPAPRTGKFGRALAFDGVDDYLEVRGLPWATNGAFSLSLWFRGTPRGQSGYQYLASVGKFGSSESLQIWFAESTRVLRTDLAWANDLTDTGPLDVDLDLLDDGWHHYALVGRQGGLCEVWIDGRRHAITQLAGSRFTPKPLLVVGQRSNFDKTRAFRGLVDELRISSRAFSPTEIRALYSWRRGIVAEHGAGCRGSAGVPSLEIAGDPDLGAQLDFRVERGSARSVAVLALGLSRTTWGSLTLPFLLDAFGARGCNLRVSIDFGIPLPLDANGAARLSWSSPLEPSFLGARLHAQGLVLDSSANSLGMSFTDGETIEFGGLR